MCKANRQEAQIVKNCFDIYYGLSGQKANTEKLSILFFKWTNGSKWLAIQNILGFNEMTKDSIYAGNFLIPTRNKSNEFKGLKERIDSWLLG